MRAVLAALLLVPLFGAVPLGSPAAADHGPNVSHNEAAFLEAIGEHQREDFERFAEGSFEGTVPGVTLSSSGSPLSIITHNTVSNKVLWNDGPLPREAGNLQDYRIDFLTPTDAVGFNLVDVYNAYTQPTVTVSFAPGADKADEVFTIVDNDNSVFTPYYFGYQSTRPDIAAVTVRSGIETEESGFYEEMGIDNLSFAVGAPPATTPGDAIVFSSNRTGGYELWSVAPDGSGLRQLTQASADDTDPQWSPDGSKVVFVAQRDGNPEIYVLDVASGAQTRMTNNPGHDADPTWSSDGTRIAFASSRAGSDSFDIYELSATAPESGSNPAVNLTNDGTGAWDSFPAYDRFGNLLFQSIGRDGQSDFELYRRSMFWTGEATAVSYQQLTTNTVHDQGVQGSPVGDAIAFTRQNGAGGYSIHLLSNNPDLNLDARLTAPTSAVDYAPTFSPDAATIAYSRESGGQSDLHLLPVTAVDSATPPPLASAPGFDGGASWFGSLRVTVSAASVNASPAKVPTHDIPTQHRSPHAVDTAPLELTPSLTPLELTPSLVPLELTPSLTPLELTPSLTPLELTPSLVPLELTPSLTPLELTPSLVPLELTPSLVPAALDELKRIPFSTITIASPPGADGVLAGSTLAGRPMQDLSLYDVALDPIAGPRLRSLTWENFDLRAALGHVGVGMFLLGDTRLDAIDSPLLPWCEILEGLGYGAAGECGGPALTASAADNSPDPRKGLSARPLDLAIAGVPFDAPDHPIQLHRARLGEITLAADAELLDARLANLQLLRTTNYGAVPTSTLPESTRADASLIDCSGDWCNGANSLYDAMVAGRLRDTFRFRHLGDAFDAATLGEAIFGLFGVNTVAYEDYTTDQLGILSYNDPGATPAAGRLTYTANHRERSNVAGDRTLTLRLPGSMVPLPDTAVLSVSGDPISEVPPAVTRVDDEVHVTWTYAAQGVGSVVAGSVTVAPGVRIGTLTSGADVTGPGFHHAVGNQAPVQVGENFEGNDTPATATPIETNVLHVGHAASGVDYYKVTINPGEIGEIVLGNRESGDNDLVVYYPDGAAGVGADDRLITNIANEPAAVPYDDAGTSPNRIGEPVAGGTLDDLPLLDRPVAGISDTRSRANERVSFLALPVSSGPSEYLIQVSSYLINESFGPYTLRVSTRSAVTPPACSARSGVSALTREGTRLQMPTVAADRRTVFLVNEDRLRELYPGTEEVNGQPVNRVDALLDKTQELANHPKVNGVLVPLDADPTFREKQHAADLAPCDPLASNAAFRAGHDAMTRVLGNAAGQIKNVVLLGSGEALTKAFQPDGSQTGNESFWVNEIRSLFAAQNNSVLGAGANLATDDPWGATAAVPYGPRYLYLPSRAVGRLVDSPSDIRAAMQRFIDSNGRLQRQSAFTAGGYFMKDLATEVDRLMEVNTGAAQPHRSDDGWNRNAAMSNGNNDGDPALFDPPDFLSLNTHSNPFGSGPPGSPASPFRSSDLDAAGAKVGGTVLYGIGCHTGTEFADVLMSSPAAEFAQAATRNGGLLVGQTGYGLGLEHRLAFSERLLVEFARRLDGSLTIGDAMVAAKKAYLPVLSPYDEKALSEINLFGLPMFEVGEPKAAPVPTSDSTATGVDPRSGLQTASLSVQPNLSKVTTPDGAFWEQNTGGAPGTGETLDVQYRPVQAQLDYDVTQPFGTARGAWVTSRVDAIDESGFDPLFVAPALSGASADPVEPQPGDVIFPAAPLTMQGVGDRQRLSVVPTQFESTGTAGGKTIGRSSRSTQMGVTVFYAPPGNTDVAAPTISSVGAVKENGIVTFLAEAHDDEGPIVRGSILFEDSAGVHFVELAPSTPDGNGLWTAVAPFAGDTVRYETRFLDSGANVAITKNKGGDFEAAAAPVAPEGVTARVVGSTPTNGYYGHGAAAEVAGAGLSFEYRLDGEPAWHTYSGPVPVAGDGTHVFAYRASNGESGTLLVPIDTAAPDVRIHSPSTTGSYQVNQAIVADFECLDPSGTTCTAADETGKSVLDGGLLPSSPGQHTLTVRATDGAGRESVASVTYNVAGYTFEGFFSPVRMDALNVVTAGSTVPMKWRLRDANGIVRDLDVVKVLRSERVVCPQELPTFKVSLISLTRNALHYDLPNEQYVYGWKTEKLWMKTCRTFELQLSDGAKYRVQFKFT